MKIGYLGPAATFTHEAAMAIFPTQSHLPFATIPDSLDAFKNGEVDATLVPLENALEGSVNITLDYLIHEMDHQITAEITMPIRQHFMVHPNYAIEWDQVDIIYSHSHALAQCHQFLQRYFPRTSKEPSASTAAAAVRASENPDQRIGAIANSLAARHHNLEIVKHDIHDAKDNYTRFALLSTSPVEDAAGKGTELTLEGYKTTLVISLPIDEAGSLHQVLSAFAWRKLNLSKIESRPMKTGLGNYFFIIDIQAKMDDVLIPGAIQELETLGCSVKLLGSYPCYCPFIK